MAIPRPQNICSDRPDTETDALAKRNITTRLPARDVPSTNQQFVGRSIPMPSAGPRIARKPSDRLQERSRIQSPAFTPSAKIPRPSATKERAVSYTVIPGVSRIPPVKSTKQRAEGSGAANLRLATVRTDLSRTPSLVSASTLSTSGSPQLQQDARRPSGSRLPMCATSSQGERNTSGSAKPPQMSSIYLQRTGPSPLGAMRESSPRHVAIAPRKEEDYAIPTNQYTGVVYQAPDRYGPTPPYALINTPSTNYSPGPFSISSTPTSMSSYSSGTPLTSIQQPTLPKLRQPSPGLLQPTPGIRQMYIGQKSGTTREHSASSSSTIRPIQQRTKSGSDSSKINAINVPIGGLKPKSPEYKAADAQPRVFPEFRHLNNVAPAVQIQRSEREPTISLMEALDVQPPSDDHHAISTLNTNIQFHPSFLSRYPSPTRSQASLASPFNTRPPTREPTPDANKSQKSGDERSQLPQRAKSSRFGFLTKKAKSEHAPKVLTRDKPSRKGPVAGTGHEGYGRFAGRGRSGSTTSGSGASLGAERSPSIDSNTGLKESPSRKSSIGSKVSAESDEFVTERLTPVTLRGAGPVRLGLPIASMATSSPSKQNLASNGLGASTISSGDQGSIRHGQGKRPVLLPSLIPDAEHTAVHNNADSPFSPAEIENSPDTTALPQVVSAPASGSRLSMTLGRGRGFSRFQQKPAKVFTEEPIALEPAEHREYEIDGPSTFSSLKTPKILNFFHRTRSPVRQTQEEPKPDIVPVLLKTLPRRSTAHYAFSTTPKRINLEELEQIMREAEEGIPTPTTQHMKPSIPMVELAQPQAEVEEETRLVSTPEPQDWMRSSPASKTPVRDELVIMGYPAGPRPSMVSLVEEAEIIPQAIAGPEAESLPAPEFELKPRVPRLQQVGRIPKVISTRPKHREHTRQLSEASFSRPFAPSHPSPAMRSSIGNTLDFVMSQPAHASVDRASIMAPVMLMHSPDLAYIASPGISPGVSLPSTRINSSDMEYIRLMGQKYAERSSGSSSGYSFPITAALTSLKPELPLIAPEEDVWGEYDDLLDALSPQEPKTPKSAVSTTSSAGAPFHYDTAVGVPKIGPLPDLPSSPVTDETVTQGLAPRVVSTMQRVRLRSKTRSGHLSTMAPLVSPTSPMSISDYLDSYNQERIVSILDPISGRLSLPAQPRDSTGSHRRSLPVSIHARSSTNSVAPLQLRASARESLPATKRASSRRDSRLMEQAENQHLGTESMASLRFDALMTSKWLSFGRVLFSPIHFELKDPAQDRILVQDGLGKDWSHYLALTYPQATIYNLGPEAAPIVSPTNIDTLSNYHHMQHPTLSAPLPFPKGHFAAVVFRFPIATTESAYRVALSECKRVLRPGGYLELSVLDIDMLHMGNRARKAVRQLKMEMQAEDPNTSLKPLSDTVQTLLGRRGFENLNRCFVGVPVTALATAESETKSDAGSEIEDNVQEGVQKKDDTAPKRHRKKLSLITDQITTTATKPLPCYTTLLNDQSPQGEEGMVKMIARVARWWYMRCYESVVLPDSDVSRSIWADEALRKECEKKGTGLRLMVCFAQKPVCSVRRTNSL